MNLTVLSLVIFSCFGLTIASYGDASTVFRTCYNTCIKKHCTNAKDLEEFYKDQSISLRLTFWNCNDECKYNCMWVAVTDFKIKGVPDKQFYGKWPFVRILGAQEPASALFSFVNFIAYIFGIRNYIRKASTGAPMFYLSLAMGIVALNAWYWSAVFHTRDFFFTEKMDYFSATLLLVYGLYLCICRFSYHIENPVIENGSRIRFFSFLSLFLLYCGHVYYLTFVKFDYQYNIIFNLIIGLSSVFLWLFYHWQSRKLYTHQWKGSFVMAATALLVSLEFFDFPPLFWMIDSHSLWHLCTSPFPLLWMDFLAEDCNELNNSIRYKLP